MGPNVRVDGNGPQTDTELGQKIVNGVKGVAKVADLLGVELPPEPAPEA